MSRTTKQSMLTSGICSDVLQQWPSVFTAVSVITNRATPYHRDISTAWEWYDLILSFGPYRTAPLYLPILGVRVNNSPGTVCAFSGRALRHGVRRIDSARISIAFYTRKNVQEGEKVQPVGWMHQSEYEDDIGQDRCNIRRRRPTGGVKSYLQVEK